MSSIQYTKKISLIDCNSFYVSCERLFNPKIRRKPVVVLSNNDGCIISRSNEAKALGIKMGEPYFKAKDIIIKNKVNVFSSNYSLYGDLSKKGVNRAKYLATGLMMLFIVQIFFALNINTGGYWQWVILGLTGNIGVLVHPILNKTYPSGYSARSISTIVVSISSVIKLCSNTDQ